MNWTDQAACLDSTVNFFPENGNGREALAICATCPVRLECLDDAMSTEPDEYGIRGGMSALARSKLKEQRDSNVVSFLHKLVPIIEEVARGLDEQGAVR